MSNISNIKRDAWMLHGPLAKKGYDWWWHSFTAIDTITGEKKPFYIEFFTCNPRLVENEPVIVWNNKEDREKGIRPSYLMVNVGFWGQDHRQLHRFFSLNDVKIHQKAPYKVSVADCYMSEHKTTGSINVTKEDVLNHPEWMSDAGSIKWNIQINKQIAYHVGYGAGSFFRMLNAFEMFWHAEGMKTLYSGEIILDGKKYKVSPDTCNGYADKNWGGDFTSPWVWLSSNDLYSKTLHKKLTNSVFNIGGGRPKVFGLALNRKLLGEFYYEGKDYEFNFSKFWTFSKTKFECSKTDNEIIWHVKQTTIKYVLDTYVTCKKMDMLKINYEAPNGTKRHNNLWNGGTGEGVLKLYKKKLFKDPILIDEVEAHSIGCEYGEYDK